MTPGVLDRAASLAAVLRRDPQEFMVRIGAIVTGRLEPLRYRPPNYEAMEWDALVRDLPADVQTDFAGALEEPELGELERELGERAQQLADTGIDSRHNGDLRLARCCYAMVRALRPAIVVETGVAHGVSTTFLLSALERNGAGSLHSIDLPPHDARAEAHVGALVPPRLRARWQLHRGMAARVLPPLLERLGRVDLFVHDSMHTYRNMTFEFAAAWRAMPGRGAIIADDIEANRAFLDLRARAPRFWAVCRQGAKPALFGVAVR